MKIAFYCRVDGQGFGFVLPEEADKLREFFAEHQDMFLFVSKSQANPAQAGDVKLKGPTGSAGCRQRAAVIFAGPAALRIFETQEQTGTEQFGGRIDQSCAETSLRTCGVQNLIY